MPDEIRMRRNVRAFMQRGGPSPANPLLYAGQDMAMISVTGTSAAQLGGIDAVNVWDYKAQNTFRQVQRSLSAPDAPNSTVVVRQMIGNNVPWQLVDITCPFNLYESYGPCKDLSDPNTGWENGYVQIYPEGIVTSKDYGDTTPFDEDGPLEASLGVTWRERPYPAGQMNFGAAGVTLTGTLVRDVTYGPKLDCGNCSGKPNDGTRVLYACAKGGAAAKPNVWYSTDGGVNWTSVSVATAANAEDLVAIAVVGSYLVVLSLTATGPTQGGYYYSTLDPITGVPSATFTKVTSGFGNNQQPRDMVAVSDSEIWICADAGIIYKTTDIPNGVTVANNGGATTQNLARIEYLSPGLFVAVGAANAVIRSTNRGVTWTTVATAPSLGALTALAIVSPTEYIIGGAGSLNYTLDGGNTWTLTTFAGSGAGAVNDIIVASPECIFVLWDTAAPVANCVSSWTGLRNTVVSTTPRVSGWPTFASALRGAVPRAATTPLRVNNLAVVGNATGGANGQIVLGSATVY